MKITPVINHQIQNHKSAQRYQVNFQSSSFENFNDKYNPIKTLLQNEIDEFIKTGGNATKLGEGVGGETYRFNHPKLEHIVIKRNKTGFSDDYMKEYNNLTQIPTDIVGGQEAVARVKDSGSHYLVSTLVQGKSVTKTNRYTEEHLKTLFNKMFELDKLGIYHGDLNGKNILINDNGAVNFIDYQWTEKVDKINFFDSRKSKKILLPLAEFPENAQMFEMASIPHYIESFDSLADKEQFLKMYLQTKSNYHEKRYEYIKKITKNWPYTSEKERIQQALDSEKAKAEVYQNPDENILKLEMKKFQFLSDYRDAYSHVDPNLPPRNILASPSSYLCSISSIQDYRKEIIQQLTSSCSKTKTDYLKSMLNYGDYWYDNLIAYTKDTYDYIIRMATKTANINEEPHKFYINERNPRIFTPNLDLLESMGEPYKPLYESGLDSPYLMIYKLQSMYENSLTVLDLTLKDPKSVHKIEKIKSLFNKTQSTVLNKRLLDTLNASELSVLKIREFRGYVKHNFPSYIANKTLNNLLENAAAFSQDLFKSIFSGLQSINPKNITVKGYQEMRKFLYKI